jgi:hypothetical protein
MRFLLVFLMVICSGSLVAQSLTGIWRGKRTQGSQGCFPEYFLELHITYSNETTLMGNAYSYVDNKQFTKVNFTGRYNPLNKRMVITESAVLQYSVPIVFPVSRFMILPGLKMGWLKRCLETGRATKWVIIMRVLPAGSR